jgi:hypothetical protein
MSGNSAPNVNSPVQPMPAGGATWVENWFRPTVVAAMLTCIVVAFVELAGRVVPGWRGPHYIVFAFLVAWVGIQSERLLQHRGPDYARWRYRVVEVVIVLIAFKLIRYLPLGWDVLEADVRLWAANPGAFLDSGFIYGGIAVLTLWLTAITITKSLYLMEVHPSEIPPDPTSPDYDWWISDYGRRVDRKAVLKGIIGSYFQGGILLLILTGLARLSVPVLFKHTPPPLSGSVINALIYFALGLALISQAHFGVLQFSWRVQRLRVSPLLGTRWAWQTVACLALIVVVALVLPTGYSVGLPQAIIWVVTATANILFGAVSLLLYLLMLLLGWLATLLGFQQVQESASKPSLPQMPSVPQGGTGAVSTLTWLELLRSVVFWGIFLAILGYSIYHFFRERPGLFPGLEGGLLARLIAWWRELWRRGLRVSARARQTIIQRLSRRLGERGPLQPWRIIRLSRLSPRQRVRYFYLSVLRRAARAGHVRRLHQTPYEYQALLSEQVPEATQDMETLTQTFVVARYSQHPVSDRESNVVKEIWRRVRAILARKRARLKAQEESGELAG